jgi:hypothetical protein
MMEAHVGQTVIGSLVLTSCVLVTSTARSSTDVRGRAMEARPPVARCAGQ